MTPFKALDIETIPQARTLAMNPPESFLTKGIRDNWKDDTIEKHREAQAKAWAGEAVKIGSLDWRLGQIVAGGVGWQIADTMHVSIGIVTDRTHKALAAKLKSAHGKVFKQCKASGFGSFRLNLVVHKDEQSLLNNMFAELSRVRIVGFNLRNFDLWWMMTRAALTGVPRNLVPRLNMSRYSTADVADLMDLLSFYGAYELKGWNLARYAEWFDLPFKPVGEGVDVYEQYKAGDHHLIVEHLLYDVLSTWCLADLFKGLFV